jgi:hypothetical protein
VGLASKVTWGQRLVSGGGPKPCFMQLWDVNAKPRGSSKPSWVVGERLVREGGARPCFMRLWDAHCTIPQHENFLGNLTETKN